MASSLPLTGPDGPDVLTVVVAPAQSGDRLDRVLAGAPAVRERGLSRTAVGALIGQGAVAGPDGRTVGAPSRKVKDGETYRLQLPPPAPARPEPEPIPLAILHEDPDLIVVDKPAGMVVHPAPGAASGTLVNALLHHCGDGLSGIGGEARPGIVHRIDKDTSGLLVVAKTQAAHAGLAPQFAEKRVERCYLAVAVGALATAQTPRPRQAGLTAEGQTLRVETQVGRHPRDRVRMAVLEAGGRRAVTRFTPLERYETVRGRPLATLLACRLETGRTHQIRVHAAHAGHPLAGDPLYGRARGSLPLGDAAAEALAAFPRQALHAMRLGFRHPISDAWICFESAPPRDMSKLLALLRRNGRPIR